MHRTYSLRQNRAPTASETQSAPVPTSSTKSGRFFGKGSLGNSFRRSTAGTSGPEGARKITQLIKTEKSVIQSIENLSIERRNVAKALTSWGEDNEADVSDITDKLAVLIYEMGMIDDNFIDRYDHYRMYIKAIRNIEVSVQPSRTRKQQITDKIAMLKYKDPQSPKILVLEQELVRAEAESLVAEAQLSNVTREKLKIAFNYLFDSFREYSERIAVCASYGKAMLQLLDDSSVTPGETRPVYNGYELSKQILIDCENALHDWQPSDAKPALSIRHEEEEDDDGEYEEEEEVDVLEPVDGDAEADDGNYRHGAHSAGDANGSAK